MGALLDTTGGVPAFSEDEIKDFHCHEAVIEKNLMAFLMVGRSLTKIREKGYYLLTHRTFEAYCEEKWKLSRAQAYRAIDAAEVVANLSPIGDKAILPINEAQTRPLARLEPEQQQPAWERAVEIAGDERVTARHVEQAVREAQGGVPSIEEEEEEPETLSGGGEFYAPILKAKQPAAQPAEKPAEDPKPKPDPAGDEWYTREEHAAMVREVLGPIDLDPASCAKANAIICAARYFDKAINGLAQSWKARNIYLNPPYSEAGDWVEMLVATILAEEVEDGAILLVNANTSSAWFADLWEHATALCFVRGRISFVSGEREESKTGWSPSVYVYFGDHPERFAAVFSRIGRIVRAWDEWGAAS